MRRRARTSPPDAVVLPAGTVIGAAADRRGRRPRLRGLSVRRRRGCWCSPPAASSSHPGKPLRPGQIYESNAPMLAAAVEERAAREPLRFVPDDVDAFLPRSPSGLAGRRSRGDLRRRQRRRLRGGEGRPDRARRRIRQGRDAAGGAAGRRAVGRRVPVVTLPGNPVSSLVSFEVFVRPALRAPWGTRIRSGRGPARLAERADLAARRRQFRRGVLDAGAGTVAEVGGPGVAPARAPGAGRLPVRRPRGGRQSC